MARTIASEHPNPGTRRHSQLPAARHPGRGAAALLPDGVRQAALFHTRTGHLYALDNRDPFTGAAVLSRGLTGTHQGRPFVASPLLKQRFDLISGECLDDEGVRVTTYGTRLYSRH